MRKKNPVSTLDFIIGFCRQFATTNWQATTFAGRTFVDGNKRIGFTAAVLFLKLNNCHFAASEVDATLKTLALTAHEQDGAGFAA